MLAGPEAGADVARADGSGRYLVTSFDPGCLAAVRAGPALPTGQLAFEIRDVDALLRRAAEAGHVAVNPWDPFVDEAFVGAAHDAGLQVYPWTVDDPARMAALARRSASTASSPTSPTSCGRSSVDHDEVEHGGLVAEPQGGDLAEVVAVDLVGERAVAAHAWPR